MSKKSSSKKQTTLGNIMDRRGINRSATAAALGSLEKDKVGAYGLPDEWKKVKCPDKTEVEILKDPEKAFEYYGKTWSVHFNGTAEVLKAKASVGGNVDQKIMPLYNNLGSVDAVIKEMYKNSYLTYAATPCD